MTSKIITSPVGAKAQVTLPKAVREALHLKAQHDLVGFVVHGGRVALTRIEPVPSFTVLDSTLPRAQSVT